MLDDTLFEESYTNAKVMQGYGPSYIKRKLYEKGIKQSIDVDTKVLEERLLSYFNAMYQTQETRSYARSKFIKKMLNKGYELAMIEGIFDEQDVAYNNEKLKNEYRELAEKLKKRYGDNDYQLNQQIKQRLQQKGYSYQEVMAVMREDDE
jgi:SOS response regulatory protein OraA/RecX